LVISKYEASKAVIMANTIESNEFVQCIAATIAKDIPMAREGRINNTLSGLLKSGSGDTIDVLIPNFGIVTEGESFFDESNPNVQTLSSIEALDVKTDKVPVKVGIKKVGASWDQLDVALRMSDKEELIDEPRISQLASRINMDIFSTVFSSAASAIVGPIGFPELGDAESYVKSSRVGDKYSGVLSPTLNNQVASSGQQRFGHSSIGKDLYNNVIGSRGPVEYFENPDAAVLRLGVGYEEEFALSGDVATINDGATELVISNVKFGGAAFGIIPKGTPFVIGSGNAKVAGSIDSPFTMSNVYGDDLQIARTFVALEDTRIIEGGARVKVAPIWLKSKIGDNVTRSKFNVANTFYTGNASQSNLKIMTPLLYGAKYNLGAVFASKCAAFASCGLRPFATAKCSTTSFEGEINVRTSLETKSEQGRDLWITAVCYGISPLYSQGCTALYAQTV
jgi:hypothetical protein